MPAAYGKRAMEEILPLAVLSLKLKQGKQLAKTPERPHTALEWAVRHRRIDGHPFSLDRFRPLTAVYQDSHPHLVIIKPAQRGVSEFAINLASFALEHGADEWAPGLKDGLNVAYLLPTIDALGDFSKERWSGLEQESFHLAKLFGEHDEFNAVRFKQVGKSFLYLRGGWSTRALKTFPADVLFVDEFDEMEPRAPALARRRLNASLVRREVDLSTPTIPGYGIHAEYARTDQRVYRQKHRCGEWVGFDFFKHVRVDDASYAGDDGWQYFTADRLSKAVVTLHCPACDAVVDDTERCAEGEWAALEPSITHTRGYHIPWWPFPVADLRRFAIAAISQDPTEIEQFHQQDLGSPYAAAGGRISRELILAMSASLTNGQLPPGTPTAVTMGVDVGTRFHCFISGLLEGKRCALAVHSVREWSDVYLLMEQYHVRLCVIDALPEQHGVAAFKMAFPGRIISAGYPANATALKATMLAPNTEGKPNIDAIMAQKHVQVNRTMAMDAVSAIVHTASEAWPLSVTQNDELLQHLTSCVRVTLVDKTGQPQATWVHTTPDHFFHAKVYDHVARTLVSVEAAGVFTPPEPNDPTHEVYRGLPHATRRRML